MCSRSPPAYAWCTFFAAAERRSRLATSSSSTNAATRARTCGSAIVPTSASSSFQSASSAPPVAAFSGFFGSGAAGGATQANSAASCAAASTFAIVSILSWGLPWNVPTIPSTSTRSFSSKSAAVSSIFSKARASSSPVLSWNVTERYALPLFAVGVAFRATRKMLLGRSPSFTSLAQILSMVRAS